ncbi:MAG: threonine--tRNA ligase, partial [Nitrospirae bacterium]|nr:threonine--tRNA ligase [Nitrospirota bacterium]
PHPPIMIHRALMGSLERFFGVLIEHYAGAFPFWLSPVQARILSITDAQKEYAEEIRRALANEGFRVDADLRNEKLGYKVREAQMAKIPYVLVLGKKEMENRTAAVRKRGGEDLGPMDSSRILALFREEMAGIKL